MAIRWVASQVERFLREGRNYNRRLKAAWKRNGYTGEAPKVDLARLKEDITTGAELNRQIAQFKRFNASTNPSGMQPVTVADGSVVPRQLVREQTYALRRENMRRKRTLYEMEPGYDDLSNVEKATLLANKNLTPQQLPKGANPLDDLGKFGYFGTSDREYAEKYIDTLRTVAGSDPDFDRVYEIVERLADENPYALRVIFENSANDPEVTIDFVYQDKSADKTPWNDYSERGRNFKGKKSRIIKFWEGKADEYLR